MKQPTNRSIRRTLNESGVTVKILLFSGFALLFSDALLWSLRSLSLNETMALILVLIAAILGLLFVYLRRLLIEPFAEIVKVTNKISEGKLSERINLKRSDEVGLLSESINAMTAYLEHRLAQLSNLCEISRESTSSLSLQTILDSILAKAVNFHQAESGSIMLLDEETNELIIKAAINIDPEIVRSTRSKIGEGIAGWVAKEAKPLLLLNGVTFKGTRDLKDAVSIPIMLKEKVVGVLNLSNKKSGGVSDKSHAFNTKDLEFLTTLANQAASVIHNAQLFERLRRNYFSIIQALAAAIDAKDSYTHGHSARVAEYAVATVRELGMPQEELETIQAAAYLHDVGKIGVPELILGKLGNLTDEEFEIIKTHPEISARILAPVQFNGAVIPIVRHHHERYNGTGYPDHLSGENIPLEARILAIADSFDAMTSSRPYRPARSVQWAKEEIRRCAGTQFDPKIVDVFLLAIEKVLKQNGDAAKTDQEMAVNVKLTTP